MVAAMEPVRSVVDEVIGTHGDPTVLEYLIKVMPACPPVFCLVSWSLARHLQARLHFGRRDLATDRLAGSLQVLEDDDFDYGPQGQEACEAFVDMLVRPHFALTCPEQQQQQQQQHTGQAFYPTIRICSQLTAASSRAHAQTTYVRAGAD